MKIRFTKRAESSFYIIKNNLELKWGGNVAEAFLQRTVDFLSLLQDFPQLGTVEEKEKEIYGFQLTKQTKVFYRIKGDIIILLAFFDVRQDPKKKPK